VETVRIEIHDVALAARIQKQLQATGSASVEEVLHCLRETQEEQDRWPLERRETIGARIKRGIEQLGRGQAVPEDQLDAHLAKLKSQMNARYHCRDAEQILKGPSSAISNHSPRALGIIRNQGACTGEEIEEGQEVGVKD
jgi:hypothetical protein